MSDATRIRPDATREAYVNAVTAAVMFSDAAVRTEDPELIRLGVQLQREAWIALQDHDARQALFSPGLDTLPHHQLH